MRRLKNVLILALLVVAPEARCALPFVIAGFGPDLANPIADSVADLVTDEFRKEFPAASFQIVMMYGHAKLEADDVCFAVTGVVPVSKTTAQPTIPSYRFTNINRERVDANARVDAKQKCLLKAIRGAVQAMMAERASDLRRRAELP